MLLPVRGKVYSSSRLLFGFCCIAMLSLACAVAQATPATYVLTHSKVSGSFIYNAGGGFFFNDAEFQIQLALSDIGLFTNNSGNAPANGDVIVRSPIFTGDQLSFKITGGGLQNPVSGTYTSATSFRLVSKAIDPSDNGELLFSRSSDQLPYFSFYVPGTRSSPMPTLDRVSQSVSFVVDQPGNPVHSSLAQNPSGSGNFIGGASIPNASSLATSLAGTLNVTQATALYNGSWATAVVPEPSTLGLAILAGGAFFAVRAWRRRTR